MAVSHAESAAFQTCKDRTYLVNFTTSMTSFRPEVQSVGKVLLELGAFRCNSLFLNFNKADGGDERHLIKLILLKYAGIAS